MYLLSTFLCYSYLSYFNSLFIIFRFPLLVLLLLREYSLNPLNYMPEIAETGVYASYIKTNIVYITNGLRVVTHYHVSFSLIIIGSFVVKTHRTGSLKADFQVFNV